MPNRDPEPEPLTVVSYEYKGKTSLAFLVGDKLYDLVGQHPSMPTSAEVYKKNAEKLFLLAKFLDTALKSGKGKLGTFQERDKVTKIEVVYLEDTK